MLVGGTLLGATVSVGIAATMLYMAGARRPAQAAANGSRFENAAPAVLAPSPTLAPTPTLGPTATPTTGAPSTFPIAQPTTRNRATPPARGASRAASADDALAREASLVDAARNALARGDAREALRAIRATRALPERQLLPEELTVEGQALRMVGRGDQAAAVEADLKSRYPDSALAR